MSNNVQHSTGGSDHRPSYAGQVDAEVRTYNIYNSGKGQMLWSEQLRTVHKGTGQNMNKNKKNQKNTDINNKKNDTGASSSSDEAMDKHYDKEDGVDFLVREGRAGMKERAFNDKAYHQRNQFENVMAMAPGEILLTFLSEVSRNKETVQYELVNNFNLTKSDMKESFLFELENGIQSTESEVNSIREEMIKAHAMFIENNKNLNEQFSEERDVQDSNKGDELSDLVNCLTKKYKETLNKWLSLLGMRQMKIVQGKAYFPRVLSVQSIEHNVEKINDRKFVNMDAAALKKSMDSTLIQQKINSIEYPSKFFSFIKPNINEGRLLYTTVTYLSMEDDVTAANYYKRNFLSPPDKIMKYVEQPGPNAAGRMEAHVLIELGSEKLPPRKMTAGRVGDYFKDKLQNQNLEASMIPILEAELAKFEKIELVSAHPDIKNHKANTEDALNEFKTSQKRMNNLVDTFANRPRHAYLDDPKEMVSKIQFKM
ncbi:hypothetical protein JCM33374_g3763 [Metschnikowia sp. JCM 33374]|nr:hypothetical protein JCM33374_g3763 [Metschnikowia sp. JCM 33374]